MQACCAKNNSSLTPLASLLSAFPCVVLAETFVYNFIADTAGTFWWHSHYGTQYVDGLWGALIVRDPSARPTYETDAVVTITDYYHELATPLTDYYLSPESGVSW